MSLPRISRNHSFADIARGVEADLGLSKHQKQDMTSALKTCARVLGKPPELIPSDPRQLGPLLAAAQPAAVGVSERRWANIRSLVSKAVALMRDVLPARQLHPLLVSWQALLDQFDPPYHRYAVMGCLRWLSGLEIGPNRVRLEDVETYMNLVRTKGLSEKPDNDCRRLILTWRHASETVPGWPALPLVWQSRRAVRSFDWSAFPGSFRSDVERWLSRLRGDDLMDEDGPSKPLKPVTIKSYEQMMKSSAWSLVQQGVEPAAIRSLADLVAEDAFKAILTDCWERAGRKVTTTIARRADVLICVARHHVKLPRPAIEKLRQHASKVEARQTGMTDKNIERLRPFNNPQTIDALFALPFAMRRDIDAGKITAKRAAEQALAAVGIGILLLAPMRLKNLRQIEIGKHLHIQGEMILLSFRSDEVKNAQPLEFELDGDTADLVRWYMKHHRPLLEGAQSALLFPGAKGGRRTDAGLSLPITRTLSKRIGVAFNVHLFRHLAAKLYLDANPGDYETARQLLGHKSLTTTRKFYLEFSSRTATRLYRALVTRRRTQKDDE